MMIPSNYRKNAQAGFSLVEVVLALGICVFALTSVIGLLVLGLDANRDSVAQTVAANIARNVVVDLQAITDWSGGQGNESKRFKIQPSTSGSGGPQTFYLGEDGNQTVNQKRARFRVDVVFGESDEGLPPTVRVVVSWPGNTKSDSDSGLPKSPSGSFEVVTVLSPN